MAATVGECDGFVLAYVGQLPNEARMFVGCLGFAEAKSGSWFALLEKLANHAPGSSKLLSKPLTTSSASRPFDRLSSAGA